MSNLDLATLLGLLSDYDRPNLHQVSGSATPGSHTAGLWFCEVGIRGLSSVEIRALSVEDQDACWKANGHVGARCIGYDMDPTEAARKCLAACQETMEGPRGRWLRPVSKEAAIAIEKERSPGQPIA